MSFTRRRPPTSIEQERTALREQHAALEELKRQLADRVEAVREREVELHHALNNIVTSEKEAAAAAAAAAVHQNAEADTGEGALQAARRERQLLERERTIGEREVLLDERSHKLERRSLELDARHTNAEPPRDLDETRLAQIEARVAELRTAETLFLRTRVELTARSEAIAAREQLVSRRERELHERERVERARAAGPALPERGEQLRRLEQQQQQSGEQTLGFSGGLRKLEQGTRPQRPGSPR